MDKNKSSDDDGLVAYSANKDSHSWIERNEIYNTHLIESTT